jgi:hypothetical protein
MSAKSKSSKKGGATFGYVEQFNYPLSPCYKNTVKAGWHSGGSSCSKKIVEGYSYESKMDGGNSCSRKSVEGMTSEPQMNGGSDFFDWLFGQKKKTKKSTKKPKSTKSSNSTSEKKKKTSEKKKKTSEKKKKTTKK